MISKQQLEDNIVTFLKILSTRMCADYFGEMLFEKVLDEAIACGLIDCETRDKIEEDIPMIIAHDGNKK